MADQDSNKINLPLALSSSTPSWWDLHHHATRPTLSTSSKNNTGASGVNFWETHSNLKSFSCDNEDVSISASNLSSLTVDESSHQFVRTPSSSYITRQPSTDNNIHVWSQFLLGIGGSQEMSRDGMGENLLNAISLKCFSGGMFETSSCGEYFDKQSINSNAGYTGDNNSIENIDHERSLNTLTPSNLVSSNWSIAPPDQPELIEHPCNDNIHFADQYPQLDITTYQTKQSLEYQPQSFGMGPASIFYCENSSLNDEMKQDNDQCGGSEQGGSLPATVFPMASFINPCQSRYRPVGDNWRPKEINMLAQHGYTPSVIDPFSNSCSESKTLPNAVSLLDASKQHAETHSNSLMTNKRNGREKVAFINEAKKRRSGDAFQSRGSLKKLKRDNSSPSTTSSPVKMTTLRTPKGKVEADKLSALQQIVSPYGKTDTASILQEAIGFIRRHQETVQEAWGILDRKGARNKVLDLKSEGICLVPVSNIPREIKEDNSGLDSWPAYRGYLYR